LLAERKGSAALLVATLIWGTSLVAQRMGTAHVGPFAFNAARFFIGSFILVPVILVLRGKRKQQTKDSLHKTIRVGVICGGVLFITATLQQIGISHTTVGKAGFLTALYIVFVPIGGLLSGKKASRHLWICVTLATIGIYLLCMNGKLDLGRGDTFIILCAVSTAVHILLIDRLAATLDSILFSCIQFFTCGVLSLMIALIFRQVTWPALYVAKYPILYTGVFSCGVAYTLQAFGQKHVPPALVALILSLESVFSVISGWLILYELLTIREGVGCLFMLAAILLAQSPQLQKNAEHQRSQS